MRNSVGCSRPRTPLYPCIYTLRASKGSTCSGSIFWLTPATQTAIIPGPLRSFLRLAGVSRRKERKGPGMIAVWVAGAVSVAAANTCISNNMDNKQSEMLRQRTHERGRRQKEVRMTRILEVADPGGRQP